MKSGTHTSEKQKPQSVKQDGKRPPADLQDTALKFILDLRKTDPIQYKRTKVTVVDKRS